MSASRWPLAIVAVALVAAFAMGWMVGQPKVVHETPAPEERQADNSLVLERAPADIVTPPPHSISRGGVEERRVSVVVQPRGPELPVVPPAGAPCPDPEPVRVDLSLVRLPDSTRRVVASSPSGEVLGGLDIPLGRAEAPGAPSPTPRALGLLLQAPGPLLGVFYDHDVGPFRLGVEAGWRFEQKIGPTSVLPPGLVVGVKAGVRF